MTQTWATENIPALVGRNAIVTGASRGIGREVAATLGHKGATVIGLSRGVEAHHPEGIMPIQVDMESLDSVREAAGAIRSRIDHVDFLIHCAGVMASSQVTTDDGFERILQTNYLAPFLLTEQLWPLMGIASRTRVVTIGSLEAVLGEIHLDDMNLSGEFSWEKAYRQSKLADIMFAMELNDRCQNAGVDIQSIAAHPGFVQTSMVGKSLSSAGHPIRGFVMGLGSRVLGQSPRGGALPILFAAASPEAEGGAYYAPGRLGGLRGAPVGISPPDPAQDARLRERLWRRTEEMLEISFGLPGRTGDTDDVP